MRLRSTRSLDPLTWPNSFESLSGGDPVWSYATLCGWRGLAIEPVSYVFRNLCRNYARWPQVVPLRGAVADVPGEAIIGLGGGETNKLLRKGTSRAGRNETVPVYDLNSVWAEFRKLIAGGPSDVAAGAGSGLGRSKRRDSKMHVDVLVIDAEGAEPRILLGAAGDGQPAKNLPAPPPSIILFEHAHLKVRDQKAIHANLARQGYQHLADLKNRDPRGARMPAANRLYARTAVNLPPRTTAEHTGARAAATKGTQER